MKKKSIKRIAKDRLHDWAAKQGIKPKSNLFMLEKLEKELKIVAPKEGEHGCTIKSRIINATKILNGNKPRSYGGSPKEADDKKVAKFYRSYQWRAVRYDILEANDGRCECCGQNKHDGIILHVDHIKPLRKNWKLRLDKNNLQILCNECNHGKGNRYETDWREPSLKALMGEAMT